MIYNGNIAADIAVYRNSHYFHVHIIITRRTYRTSSVEDHRRKRRRRRPANILLYNNIYIVHYTNV